MLGLPILKAAKRSLFHILNHTGVRSAVLGSRWRTERLLILGYHGISLKDEHEWNPSMYLSAADFEQRLEALQRARCIVLPLGTAVERLYAGTLPPRSVALTFDDGFYDFYARVLPLLRRRGYPATVYLTSYYCRYNRPVFDVALSYLLWVARGTVADIADIVPFERSPDLTTASGREEACRTARDFVVRDRFSGEQKDELLQRLSGRVGFDYDDFHRERILHLMNEREVAELAPAGVDVQLHTHRHRAPLDRTLFGAEIEENRRQIAQMTGIRASHFCYPSNTYSPELVGWAEELAIETATTCELGIATPRSNRLLLPRLIDTSNVSPVEFESWIAGLPEFLPRRRYRQQPASPSKTETAMEN